MYKILVCDDDEAILESVCIYLKNEGYEILTAKDGVEALEIIKSNEIHCLILDIMMPRLDGLKTTIIIREKYNFPIILLSAKSEDTDKILGLNVGADDYITKPFNPVEVEARVRSQLRRYLQLGGREIHPESIVIGGIELNDSAKEVTLDGDKVSLTPKEYEILKFLMSNPNRVFSPKEIYKNVWKEAPISSENTVAVHIRHLREKIEINPAEPRYLKVVFGQGYKMEKW